MSDVENCKPAWHTLAVPGLEEGPMDPKLPPREEIDALVSDADRLHTIAIESDTAEAWAACLRAQQARFAGLDRIYRALTGDVRGPPRSVNRSEDGKLSSPSGETP